MLSLRSPINQLRGIGPSTASKLSRLNIKAALDLLSHFPLRHEDLTKVVPIANLRSGITSVLKGRLQLVKSRRGWRRRRMTITEALLADGTDTIRLIWFNQPYIAKSYQAGDEVLVVGKLTNSAYGSQIQSPLIERTKERHLVAGRILPVYRATAGLTQRQIRSLIQQVLPLANSLVDWLPETMRRREKLLSLAPAIKEIHFPRSQQALESAQLRLKFGELLLFSLSILQAEQLRTQSRAPLIPFRQAATQTFVRSLPFKLTNDQRRAAWEILQDLEREQPMNRLLEGDVGSGKTVVAAIAAKNAAVNKKQSAFLAPTDILARQHYETFKRFFRTTLKVGLLTRTQHETAQRGPLAKATLLKALSRGEIDVVVGTHALLSANISIPSLALAVVDEQHRFGVEQRHALQLKGVNGTVPHLLSMTATPIPRTLALSLYGDLKLSFLRQLPPGRIPISTKLIEPSDEDTVWQYVRGRAAADEQTYVVCPLIEESDELGVAAATSEFERLQTGPLNELRLGLLHGKLTTREKNSALQKFSAGSLDVLVTTPVVEVGVDVPNATSMVILGAERFGLAQLHQLRGRVGRSAKPSTCFLLTDSNDAEVHVRLQLVESTTDGFALAEADLSRRGPGDFYGIRQSGLPEFKMASLTDLGLMQRAHNAAKSILNEDPTLAKNPVMQRKVAALYQTWHRE